MIIVHLPKQKTFMHTLIDRLIVHKLQLKNSRQGVGLNCAGLSSARARNLCFAGTGDNA